MTPEEQIKALQQENASLKADLATEQELSKAFQDELTKKQEVAAPVVKLAPKLPANVKVGKQEYKWLVASFKLPGSGGETFTAEQANKDQELLGKLVAMGFGGWQAVK